VRAIGEDRRVGEDEVYRVSRKAQSLPGVVFDAPAADVVLYVIANLIVAFPEMLVEAANP